LAIKCGVKDCMHNDRDACRAESIEVKSVESKTSRREDTCCGSFAARK
jgi:hypothetical protein